MDQLIIKSAVIDNDGETIAITLGWRHGSPNERLMLAMSAKSIEALREFITSDVVVAQN